MDLGIAGRTALVLGGGGGLGRAIAVALAREGANVALGDVNAQALTQSSEAVAAAGRAPLTIGWDLADHAGFDRHFGAIEAAFGPVDILINNTGGPPPTAAAGQDPSLWLKSFQEMVLSVIAITDRALPGMRSRKWGRIVTSTSSGVVAPIANLGISNALRLSLVGWSKTLAREVGGDGITANIVLPGRVATPRIAFLDDRPQADSRRSREGTSVATPPEAASLHCCRRIPPPLSGAAGGALAETPPALTPRAAGRT